MKSYHVISNQREEFFALRALTTAMFGMERMIQRQRLSTKKPTPSAPESRRVSLMTMHHNNAVLLMTTF